MGVDMKGSARSGFDEACSIGSTTATTDPSRQLEAASAFVTPGTTVTSPPGRTIPNSTVPARDHDRPVGREGRILSGRARRDRVDDVPCIRCHFDDLPLLGDCDHCTSMLDGIEHGSS